ncbi:tRNA uridine 5-oxyacetic acid(34) methyltransferase CmoM [Vibrio palustris]|uniref:tRNA 5-carboxymethoxyuridine methyltransferase n=1 Tax=Vibrio palustris TaxID=1918946 RepID=A0A1R4B2X9_9VIBR|nr:tRNA uridine 5-oxyacetic acid(34) methyltransferase CmoM [Vibrio palustris]SJL83272.1 putative S-adenosyl-L-methionine-dependent methyltransferase [Vibrio palustris]
MTRDRNFDDIAHKFAKNIYGSDKGEIRQVIVWEDIVQLLTHFTSNDKPLNILDAGGGLAQLSQKLAHLGHKVTLCDLSANMLSLAKQSIEHAGLQDHYRLVHAPVQEIGDHLDQSVDMVLFHAVMEWLVDPKAALETVLAQVKPGGMASIMFYNYHGLVMKNTVCGNLPHILNGMPHKKRFKLQPQQGLLPNDVYTWIEKAGFNICGKSGIRCFSDYIGNVTHMGDFEQKDVLALEQKFCRQEPYLSLGRYIHVWAQKQ